MNDSELRRRELLKQTRRLYQDSAAIPAVHPRYGHIYHELYDTLIPGKREHHSGSFFARLMLAVFLFFKLCLHRTEPSETGRYQQHTDRQRDSERNSRKWNGFYQYD